MPSVAFATYQQSPHLSDDDRLVASVLGRRGVDVHPVVWDALDVDWVGFELVVIRSTWDYHLKPGLYAQWLRSFLPAADRLWNPPAVVLGNLNKRYLVELATSGSQCRAVGLCRGRRRTATPHGHRAVRVG